MATEERKDKGLYICPNDHMYNANKYGDTCPNCGAKQEDKLKTPEEYDEELKLEPDQWVCGWLVCIGGVNKGRAYAIRDGKNFIGSDPNMDIYIKGDLEIEPRNHGVILYDSKSRETTLLAGDSLGMVYLEEKAVYDPTNLQAFSKLELGKSLFIYIKLCGADFDWKDLPQEDRPL